MGVIYDLSSPFGKIYNVAPSAPAVGNEIQTQIPLSTRWRFIVLHIELVTSSAVANRSFYVYLDDNSGSHNKMYSTAPTPTQTASLTRDYYFTLNYGISETVFDANGDIRLSLPPIIVSRSAISDCIIWTKSTNLDAGDQYTIPSLLVEEWGEDQV